MHYPDISITQNSILNPNVLFCNSILDDSCIILVRLRLLFNFCIGRSKLHSSWEGF